MSLHGDRPAAGTAAAVRLREGLVQVEVDDVEAHVAGPRDARRPRSGSRRRSRGARRRRGRRFAISSMFSSKSPSVDGFVSISPAVRSSTSVAQVRRRRRCRARPSGPWRARSRPSSRWRGSCRAPCRRMTTVRRVLAAVGEVGAHQHQAGQLALRARRRLERDRREPGDLGEDPLQLATSARARPARRPPPAADGGRGSRAASTTRSLTRGLCFIVQEPSG